MRRRIVFQPVLSVGAWLLLGAGVLLAQDVGPTLPDGSPTVPDAGPTLPDGEVPMPPPIDMEDPTWLPDTQTPPAVPETPEVPEIPEVPGPDAGDTSYQRTHTTPNGQHTQTWERSVTDEGYSFRREQTWTNPDGTPLRSHEMTLSGTDPNNFQREKIVTLRDGRTIEHTYTQSWDGTTFQSDRSFSGPNGQTRDAQRTWTASDAPESDAPESDGSLLARLNPFSKKATMTDSKTLSRSTMNHPSGFTLGSSARGAMGTGSRNLTKRQPGQAEAGSRHQQIQQHLQQVKEYRHTGRPTSPRSRSSHTR